MYRKKWEANPQSYFPDVFGIYTLLVFMCIHVGHVFTSVSIHTAMIV